MNELPSSPLCRIAPGLETDPIAMRLAELAGRLSPSGKVVITTSDTLDELPEGVLLSAQSKLARLGVNSDTAFQWVARHEKEVDWNKIKAEQDLQKVVAARFEQRAQVSAYLLSFGHESVPAQQEVNALRQLAANDPDAANVVRQFEANPALNWSKLLGYVNQQRVKSVQEWRDYLVTGNEEYAADPYWQDLVWDIPHGSLTSDRNRGLGATTHLNQGVLAEVRQALNNKSQLISIAGSYTKLQAEYAKASAKEVVATASAREWVYIPSKDEDPANFQANVQKLKDLSCSTWCTKTYNAEPYLSRGGFWLLTEGNKSVCAIRLVGDQIQEIQGVKNNSEIPPEAGPDIEDLLAAKPELKGVNLWRAKNPGTPQAVLHQLAQFGPADGDYDYNRWELQLALAERKDLTPATMLVLARCEAPRVQVKLAQNPAISVEVQLLLARAGVESVRVAIVSNRELAPAVFEELRADQSPEVIHALIRHQKLPPELLMQFAKQHQAEIQLAVVGEANLTPEILSVLSQSTFPQVRKALASYGLLYQHPEAVLRLAGDKQQHIRLKLARTKRIPDEAMVLLAKDKTAAVRLAIATRFDAPNRALRLLANDSDLRIQEALAKNAGCPAEVFMTLAKAESRLVRRTVATNELAPSEALLVLSADKDGEVLYAVASNKNTPESALAGLASSAQRSIRGAVAGNKHTPPLTLTELARDPDAWVQIQVAGNPNTPGSTLRLMAGSEDYLVRRHCAQNQNTPLETLMELTNDVDIRVLSTLAWNRRTPPDGLLRLTQRSIAKADGTQFARDSLYEAIRFCESLASNPNIPTEAFQLLSKLNDSEVNNALARNPNTPAELLSELAASGLATDDHTLVKHVAWHQSTPAATLLILSKNGDSEIRDAAAVNQNTPLEAVLELLQDEKSWVRMRASTNPALKLEKLEELSVSPDEWICLGVCRNQNVSPELLARLVMHPSQDVAEAAVKASSRTAQLALLDDPRWKEPNQQMPYYLLNPIVSAIASDPTSSPELLERVWRLASTVADDGLASNPQTPTKILLCIASSSDKTVRRHVAYNKATPKEVLKLLATDEDDWVRISAISNPNWLEQAQPAKAPEPAPVVEAAPVKEAAVALGPVAEAPNPAEPQALLFDKKRKNQLIFNFSLSGDGVEAFYDPGTDTTVFLQDKLATVERAEALFFHETFGHRNVTLFAKTPEGKAELAFILAAAEPQLMSELPDLLKATGHQTLAALKQDYGYGDTPEGKTAVLGELLARHAERLADTEPPAWFATLVNKVEVWMAKHLGTELSEGALTTWLARLPARLPEVTPEPEPEAFGTPPSGPSRWQSPCPYPNHGFPGFQQPGQAYGYGVN